MNTPSVYTSVFAIFCIFIVTIHANFDIISLDPNTTISTDTHEFKIEINRTVNRPKFSSFIHIYDAVTNTSIGNITADQNNSNTVYDKRTLTFQKPTYILWNPSTKYYITFDEGVLFSDTTSNSTDLSNHWSFKVNQDSQGSTMLVGIGTTESFTDDRNTAMSSEAHSTTTLPTLPKGESSSTRSAQLGMGLGITLIAVLLIGEITYFKYFYRGGQRRGSYVA